MKKTKLLVLGAAMAVMLNVQPASANNYIDFNYSIIQGAGAQQAANGDYWLRAIFTQDAADMVHLQVQSGDLFTQGYVTRLWLDFAGDATSLTLDNTSGAALTATGGFLTGNDSYPTTGTGVSGTFDMQIAFRTGVNADRFDAGETFTADFLGSGIMAADFLDFNNKGFFGRATIHVSDGVNERVLASYDPFSSPINTPDASATLGLLGMALMGLGMIQRRLKQ